MELKLFQKDLAILFGVSEDCITYWENSRSTPQIQYYPALIRFLGYYPFELDLTAFEGRIKAFRYINGLSQKQFATLMKINPRTAQQWEKGQGNGPKRAQIDQYLVNYNFNINEH
ncbi:helix-turn-helix domain-containing protein [Sphingobacterium multivorum]|uniref:Helix-turn-helix n=1 Tax=Sphingobacterium multivorum TaxID=28454 RepID=A0A654B7F9_SPHMU|nr:helix-turn-helix transcriptional regulator [Sphingobacterium multivorum]VXC76213.1 Helix-turn-helix [Sphingobacterium multivorum]